MSGTERITFRWPGEGPSGECDNCFVGIWHPRKPLVVQWSGGPPAGFVHHHGPNWSLASIGSPLHPHGAGLVHYDKSLAVAFRGYILPSLHAYSPTREILQYWEQHRLDEHNGVFSAAVIDTSGTTLTLFTDALGMGALYHRIVNDAVIFSTSPRYLVMEHDRPDLLAWKCLMQTAWIVGDRTLSEGVHRVAPGGAVCFSHEGKKTSHWFNMDQLPRGDRAVGPASVGEVEEVFQQAMSRCLGLRVGGVVLPLSSGFDSRRMLASLVDRKVHFCAITCRLFQKDYRDLDARFASEMARDFGFSHQVVEPDSLAQFVSDDRARRLLVDAETGEHTWAVRVMAGLPSRPALFFDGIGGDILGDPVGWTAHIGLSVGSRSAEEEVALIAQYAVTDIFDSILQADRWPTADEVRQEIRSFLRPYGNRENIGEVAFLLLRQRKAIALWSQQLLPAGYLPVCPYLDLDYVRLLLSFRAVDKHATKFQRACLREFWPTFYQYRGNRDIPDDVPPGSPALHLTRALKCYEQLYEELETKGGIPNLTTLLSVKGRIGLKLSRMNRHVAVRSLWCIRPLMELVARQVNRPVCWEMGPAADGERQPY